MHHSTIFAAIVATAAMAAPQPKCNSKPFLEGWGDGTLCYVPKCDTTLSGSALGKSYAVNLKHCALECQTQTNCWDVAFEKETNSCYFFKSGHKRIPKPGFQSAKVDLSMDPCFPPDN